MLIFSTFYFEKTTYSIFSPGLVALVIRTFDLYFERSTSLLVETRFKLRTIWTYPPSKILMRVGSAAGYLTETSFSTCSSFERSHDATPFIFLPKWLTSTGISSGFSCREKSCRFLLARLHGNERKTAGPT